jgi:putative transposase
MPSIKTITPILGGNYYHIFNRGNNGQNIFYTKNNYFHFLNLLKKYLSDYASIIAYCLLSNHFHLVIKIDDSIKNNQITDDEEIGKIVSSQLRRMFISYSMAINKQENRTGSLFEKNFKRLEITEQEYLQYAIFYVHYNPEKHGVMSNFKDHRFSSYKTYLSTNPTQLSRQLGLDIFGDLESFINYHDVIHSEREDFKLE